MSTKPLPPPATIAAGEFKAKCLDLMNKVAETGQAIVITKRGRPLAKLVPALVAPKSIFGFAKGSIELTDDIVSPLEGDYRIREDRIALLTEATETGRTRPRKRARR